MSESANSQRAVAIAVSPLPSTICARRLLSSWDALETIDSVIADLERLGTNACWPDLRTHG